MILYIQTAAIPRSELHQTGVIKALKFLDTCEHFSEIRWYVNIDLVKSHLYEFENYKITVENFENCVKNLNKTKLSLNINEKPCFYLAFRHLTKQVQLDIENNNLNKNDYCVMWLEDDWYMKDEIGFNKLMSKFLNSDKILVAPLYHYKINMGGNPDIIKGEVFEFFDSVNFDVDNKRDPEQIRKYDVFEKYIWIDPWPKHNVSFHDKLTHINTSSEEIGTTDAHEINTKIISSDVIEDVGDDWKVDKLQKAWSYGEKDGIDSSRSYTYK